MNITKRDQMLLAGLVLIIVVFAFFRFIYMPTRQEIQSLSTTRQELQQEEKRLETVVKKSPDARKDIDQKFANLNKRLPTEDELVPLLTVLDDSCKKYKVPLASLDYKGAEQKSPNGAQTLVFTVGTKGKVTQLFDFLAELETNQRLISVLDVALTAVKAEQQNTTAVTESGPPTYYIAPPGMPQAKLQRVKFEVEDTKEVAGEAEQPVASSFIPDSFEMKITINAYYAAKSDLTQVSKAGDKTVKNSENSKENKDAKGEV